MEIKVIASSSRGNAYLIKNNGRSLLIECGVSIKKLQQALDFKLSSVDGCLLSHEHQDHAKAARQVMAAGVNLYTSAGTIDALELSGHRLYELQSGSTMIGSAPATEIGSWYVWTFDTRHDAAEPLGFVIQRKGEPEFLLFATDTYYLSQRFTGLTHIMVECSYVKEILHHNVHQGLMDKHLADRLRRSHFELSNVIEFLKATDLSLVREIHLLHLSDANSDERIMKYEVQSATGKPVYIS